MTKCSPTPKPPGEKNMIARSRDWEAAEERGQALERGDFFGAAGITENNCGQEQKEVSPVVQPGPECAADTGGGISSWAAESEKGEV
jgi:hypothetical protein